MAKFLDETGVGVLWEQIKSKISSDINAVVDSAPQSYNTLKKIADQISKISSDIDAIADSAPQSYNSFKKIADWISSNEDNKLTAGDGILIGTDNKITYDPEIIPTVDYIDASISDTMNYIIQEDRAEHAGRVAGDELLQASIGKKMSLIEGGRPFIEWNGDTTNLPAITFNGEHLYKLNDLTIEDKFPDADGKTIQGFTYVLMENGEPVSHLGSGWISGSDITGSNHVIVGRTDNRMILISSDAGSYSLTIDSVEYPFEIPVKGTYVNFVDSNNYVYKIFVEEDSSSMIQQNEEDITEATAEALSAYLATQAQIENIINRVNNLQNRLDNEGTGGGGSSSDSSIIVLGQDIELTCSEEDLTDESIDPEGVMYYCSINANTLPDDFWLHPSHYNFIVTVESTESSLWGYTANHFCYEVDNYEGNWGIIALCEDTINELNVKHITNISKDTSEDTLQIIYQGFLEEFPALPVTGNICSIYLQKLS